MKRILVVLILSLATSPLVIGQTAPRKAAASKAAANGKTAVKRYPGKTWEKADSPEAAGWSSEKLKLARQHSDAIGSAAVMIVADGLVVDEWGETARRFNVHSIRKSFLSALYGIYVKKGKINLSRTMGELGIDDNAPSLTAEEKRAQVSDLIKARSGIYHPALYETPGMKAARPKRGSHPPGSFWYYNNWGFNALGTIFERATGSTIFEGFRQRIAEPLGMEDYRLEDTQYVRGEDSIHQAYPFRMTARDMARFGLLFLRRGEWRGKQVVPKEWVAESTRSYSDAGSSGGYGYMWWVAAGGKHLPGVQLKDGAFSARGAGGHYILVVPDLDLVIVHRVNTDVQGPGVRGDQFGPLVKLILEARAARRQR
jgi:CubicO group peptidase (beta-lactamase class C family)